MPIPGSGFVLLTGVALQSLGILLPKPRRSIGGVVAEVTISEEHVDQLRITDHPVEQGAVITDHAFKLPAQVTIRFGWSPGLTNILNSSYLNDIYSKMLTMQNSRVPLVILTQRRIYRDMLIEGLTTRVDKDTSNILLLTARCRQVLIAYTQVVTVPTNEQQADPELTGSVEDTGTQSLGPAPDVNLDYVPPDVTP